jgi:serine/threonine protein kinase
VKLADFGSARVLTQDAVGLIGGGGVTPLWASPESLGNGVVHTAIDVWSIGCLCIEMATADVPFAHKYNLSFQLFLCILYCT